MEIVMYELLKPFPVQEVDFKWSSGSKVNKRRWFLIEQADVLSWRTTELYTPQYFSLMNSKRQIQ